VVVVAAAAADISKLEVILCYFSTIEIISVVFYRNDFVNVLIPFIGAGRNNFVNALIQFIWADREVDHGDNH
jgi:hypothetical protein